MTTTSFAYMIPGLPPAEYSIEGIANRVAGFFNMAPDELKINTRRKETIIPRQTAMYMCKSFILHDQFSLTKTGLFFLKHHSTVLYSIRSIQNRIDTDKHFKGVIEEVKRCVNKRITQ